MSVDVCLYFVFVKTILKQNKDYYKIHLGTAAIPCLHFSEYLLCFFCIILLTKSPLLHV